jgi:hypothetical protein
MRDKQDGSCTCSEVLQMTPFDAQCVCIALVLDLKSIIIYLYEVRTREFVVVWRGLTVSRSSRGSLRNGKTSLHDCACMWCSCCTSTAVTSKLSDVVSSILPRWPLTRRVRVVLHACTPPTLPPCLVPCAPPYCCQGIFTTLARDGCIIILQVTSSVRTARIPSIHHSTATDLLKSIEIIQIAH